MSAVPEVATPPLPSTTLVAEPGTGHVRDAERGFRGTVAESLRLATAPSTGRFRPAVRSGDAVLAGDVLGFVTGGRGRADAVHSPAAATVRALLVRPGQLVSHRRALLWLEEARA